MPSGRLGRSRREKIPPIDHIWRRPRYGHRSVHDCLSTRLLELCMAEVGNCVSRLDKSGPGESLHAYVCHAVHGRVRPESQESGLEQELGSSPILY